MPSAIACSALSLAAEETVAIRRAASLAAAPLTCSSLAMAVMAIPMCGKLVPDHYRVWRLISRPMPVAGSSAGACPPRRLAQPILEIGWHAVGVRAAQTRQGLGDREEVVVADPAGYVHN